MILFALALAASHHFHGIEHDRAQHPMPMPGVTAPSKPVALTISPFAPQPVTPAPSFPSGFNPFAPQPVAPAPSVPAGFNPFTAAPAAPAAPLTSKQISEVGFMLAPVQSSQAADPIAASPTHQNGNPTDRRHGLSKAIRKGLTLLISRLSTTRSASHD